MKGHSFSKVYIVDKLNVSTTYLYYTIESYLFPQSFIAELGHSSTWTSFSQKHKNNAAYIVLAQNCEVSRVVCAILFLLMLYFKPNLVVLALKHFMML